MKSLALPKNISIPKNVSMPHVDFQEIVNDFRSMDPQNPGTWALIPKITVLVSVFILVIAGGWWFVWNDQLVELEAKTQEEGKLKEQFLDKKKQAVNLDLYLQQLDDIDRSFGALLKQLPDKSEIESLLIEVNQAGLGRGLQFELFKPGAEQVRDFYAELPISIKITGSYHDFGAFAADIAKLPRIVTLNNINIASVGGGNPKDLGGGLLSLEATTKTFRYLDEEELSKQKKGPKKAAPKGGQK